MRAFLFAAVCVLLAAAGHGLAAGRAVPAWALLPALAGTALLGWCGGRRQRGPFAIGGGLLVAQGALHVLFGSVHGASGMRDMHSMRGMQGMPTTHGMQHGMSGVHGMGGMHGTHSMGEHGGPQLTAHLSEMLHASPAMLAAHVLAAVVCALWLWRGEEALFGLLRALAALAVPPLALRTALGPCRTEERPVSVRQRRDRDEGGIPRPGDVLLQHTVVRRGPPRGWAPNTTTPVPAAAYVYQAFAHPALP